MPFQAPFQLRLVSLLVFALLLCGVAPRAIAQARGAISGTIVDGSGAVVPGAEVVAVETSTSTSQKTISSSAGEFAFANMPLGSYTITVTASGFKSRLDVSPLRYPPEFGEALADYVKRSLRPTAVA